MPLLGMNDLVSMRNEPPRRCDKCLMLVVKNYCRECDEFFEAGHACEGHDQHKGHRTY